MRAANGYVIYRGPSLLDGSPIVVIVTGILDDSTNDKTGAMVQTYIIRADVSPLDAVRSGADESVCGVGEYACKHRGVGGKQRSCYVTLIHGPRSVYAAFERGVYMDADPETVGLLLEGREVRIGTYGDPAAVPTAVWKALIRYASEHTCYTHQWANPAADPALADIAMASTDSVAEALAADALGWRHFRVRSVTEPVLKGEAVCPASKEAGKKLTCAQCGACNGKGTGRKGHITIIAHGSGSGHFERAVAAQAA